MDTEEPDPDATGDDDADIVHDGPKQIRLGHNMTAEGARIAVSAVIRKKLDIAETTRSGRLRHMEAPTRIWGDRIYQRAHLECPRER